MRIGLISDTHVPEVTKQLPPQINEAFSHVDLILHAGDIYNVAVLDELEKLAPVLAAEGDDDYLEAIRDKRVAKKHVLSIDGVIIWLQHFAIWHWPYDSVGAKLRAEGKPEKTLSLCPQVVIVGHAHRASIEDSGGVLLINPGSATFPAYKHELGTVAILNTDSGKPEVHLVQLR
ncbi:MAG: metallophosphoesterase family protein [Chloroflexi bacterium]|nr:metallophosphoesterase family protein [Chloroflexota bacterium]